MAGSQIRDDFVQAYTRHDEYPTNLIYNTTYPSDLEEYKTGYHSNNTLCVQSEKLIDVGFRDFVRADNAGDPATRDAVNAQSVKQVLGCLGDRSRDQIQGQNGPKVTKPDPVCRFIFLWSKHSLAPLKITKDLLQQILCYHQVMPNCLDFLSTFGSQDKLRELRFSGFREHTLLVDFNRLSLARASQGASTAQSLFTNPLGPAIKELGRSGWGYQLCYNLKTVVNKQNPLEPATVDNEKWSFRQGAFHHQFDVVTGTTLWITMSSYSYIQNYIEELTGRKAKEEDKSFRNVDECFKATLSVHLLLCHWSTKNWRQYLRWLDDKVKQEADGIVLDRVDTEDQKIYTATDLQDIQMLVNKVNEAKMIVESNSHVITSLRDYYKGLQDSEDFHLRISCRSGIHAFITRLNYMIADFKMHVARADLLLRNTDDLKNLVLQHMQSQATKKMEHLASESQREAIAMRIIAAVTVFYLPATFVSTFFSTDVVKYQNQNGGLPGSGTFSPTAMRRWGEVAGILTLLTLAPALLWYYWANKQRVKEFGRALRRKSMGKSLLPVHNTPELTEKST